MLAHFVITIWREKPHKVFQENQLIFKNDVGSRTIYIYIYTREDQRVQGIIPFNVANCVEMIRIVISLLRLLVLRQVYATLLSLASHFPWGGEVLRLLLYPGPRSLLNIIASRWTCDSLRGARLGL